MWRNCSQAVWRKEAFSSRFTSPKQTATAGARQPVVSAVCCWAAVSHLAVLAVFFPFLLSWRNADVCSFLCLRISGFSGNNLHFKCNYDPTCLSLGPPAGYSWYFPTGLFPLTTSKSKKCLILMSSLASILSETQGKICAGPPGSLKLGIDPNTFCHQQQESPPTSDNNPFYLCQKT